MQSVGTINMRFDAGPVGDVRGYEGMGRTSDECAVSVTVTLTDTTLSSERGAHQAGSHNVDDLQIGWDCQFPLNSAAWPSGDVNIPLPLWPTPFTSIRRWFRPSGWRLVR